jgi:epoxyqueuosine reductase
MALADPRDTSGDGGTSLLADDRLDEKRGADQDELFEELATIGRAHGLTAIGVTGADAFTDTLGDLLDRRGRGLHGGMQFTYRNPERSTDPTRILPGARSLVVGAWGYRRDDSAAVTASVTAAAAGDPSETTSRPRARVARYAQRDHYASLRLALAAVAERLRADGWRATVVCDDNALVDRAAAHRAGLGWFGKNSLLLLPGLGSWFVLGSVVTDAPLEPAPTPAGTPAVTPAPTPVRTPAAHGSGCGTCSRCMTACPTGALVSPGVLDARRCLAWLVQAPGSFPEQFREALGDRIYGCDECQTVCPINRVAERRFPPEAAESDREAEAEAEADVDLLGLLESSDAELLERHGRWYIAERQPRYLRRNALVALGNTGDGDDPATESALRRALDDPDPMIIEHAAWAAKKLGRDDLVGHVA